MNTEQTLHQMRSLKLTGMASAYQTLLSLPYDQHPPTDQLLAQLVDAEMLQRPIVRQNKPSATHEFSPQSTIFVLNYQMTSNGEIVLLLVCNKQPDQRPDSAISNELLLIH
jgi:hypothetical protein